MFPILHTTRCQLRQFSDDDLENVFKGLSHPDIIKHYGVSYATLEDTKAQLEFFADLEREETGIWWAICDIASNAFLGAGGFNNLSKTHRKAEIGFWLLTEHWSKGLMTEVMPVICQYGFENLHLHRIEGFVESDNHLCKKAMDKLDFTLEGTMHDCEIKNGNFISLDIYAKINS